MNNMQKLIAHSVTIDAHSATILFSLTHWWTFWENVQTISIWATFKLFCNGLFSHLQIRIGFRTFLIPSSSLSCHTQSVKDPLQSSFLWMCFRSKNSSSSWRYGFDRYYTIFVATKSSSCIESVELIFRISASVDSTFSDPIQLQPSWCSS